MSLLNWTVRYRRYPESDWVTIDRMTEILARSVFESRVLDLREHPGAAVQLFEAGAPVEEWEHVPAAPRRRSVCSFVPDPDLPPDGPQLSDGMRRFWQEEVGDAAD